MAARQTLPTRWLVTDERAPDPLAAADGLPRGAGILFRHHHTPQPARRALFAAMRTLARRRGLVLVLAGADRQAMAWQADGAHGRRHARTARPLLRTAPAHDAHELVAARRGGADLVFLSPLYPTRSHPGARGLGQVRFRRLAAGAGLPVIALGGMDPARARRLGRAAHGWAGIDAWTR